MKTKFDDPWSGLGGTQITELKFANPVPPLESVVLTLTPNAALALMNFLTKAKWPDDTLSGNLLNAIRHNLDPALEEAGLA